MKEHHDVVWCFSETLNFGSTSVWWSKKKKKCKMLVAALFKSGRIPPVLWLLPALQPQVTFKMSAGGVH